MTPKEAFQRIESVIELADDSVNTNTATGRELEEAIIRINDNIKLVRQSLTELEALKRYPTSEEVREALQLFWGNNYKVNVSITNQIFIESKKDKDGDSCIEWDGEKIYFDWMPCYPPHLIALIGRFYEGLEAQQYDYETSGVGDAERLLVNALTELEELKSWRDELNETIQDLRSKAKYWEVKENKTDFEKGIARGYKTMLHQLLVGIDFDEEEMK